MALLADILPEVRPDVPDCMEIIMINAIRKAAIAFCEGTHAWNIKQPPLTLSAASIEYQLSPPAGTSIISIPKVVGVNGVIDPFIQNDMDDTYPRWRDVTGATPASYTLTSPNTLRPYPSPSVDGEKLDVYITVKPSPVGDTIDDQVYNDYYAIIAAGAKAILCAMPRKEWTALDMVPYYTSLFKSGINDAKIRVINGYTNNAHKMAFRSFG